MNQTFKLLLHEQIVCVNMKEMLLLNINRNLLNMKPCDMFHPITKHSSSTWQNKFLVLWKISSKNQEFMFLLTMHLISSFIVQFTEMSFP